MRHQGQHNPVGGKLATGRRDQAARCAGFTLIEALMATGLLLVVVVAVTSAITAGQQNAYEAHRRIAASLAAEELMGRLATVAYDKLAEWNGFSEAPGSMTDLAGQAMPSSLQLVGRDVHVISDMKSIAGMDVRVRGRTLTVRAFSGDGRTLASITRFVPEPSS